MGGADFVLSSDVPIGAGLSSSAAIECATLTALCDLYDLDIEAQELARKAGLTSLLRAGAPNDHPFFIDALSAVVKRALAQ
jgi:galactokinase